MFENILDGFARAYRRETITNTRFFEVYNNVYKACTENCDEVKSSQSSVILVGGEQLYKSIKQFLTQYVLEVKQSRSDLIDEDFLKFYSKQWRNFVISSDVANGFSMYLNRYWIARERENNEESGTCVVKQLAYIIWRDLLVKPLNTQIMTAVLKLIEQERRGKIIDTGLIRTVVDSYVAVSLSVSQHITGRDMVQDYSLYTECFQKEYIADTRRFYSLESLEFLSRNSVSEYVKKVEQSLKEEEDRVERYLGIVITTPLIKECEKMLIVDRYYVLLPEFKNLFDDGQKIEELRQLFQLLLRTEDGIYKMAEILQNYVIENGRNAITKCGESSINEPEKFVDAILKEHKKGKNLVLVAFDNAPRMVQAFDDGCSKFINHNFITKMENSSSAKSAELLAKYCDILLKKSPKPLDFDNIDDVLDQIIIVFRYIEDKDVFQKFYSRALAKRLVQTTSISNDAERSMLSKLKECCGFQYTHSLQNMFNDIQLSKTLNDQFKYEIVTSQQNLELDFSVQVLTSGSWPFQHNYTFCLPTQLEKNIQTFTKFYNTKYSGRKLTWLYQLSKGEVVTHCFKNRYTLTVSSFQMAVLLQFNTCDSFTMKELQEMTQIKWEYLVQVVQVLIKAKLLMCNDGEELKENSDVRINLEYKNKKTRINLNVPLKIEVKTEQDNTHRFIEAERNILIQAAIVRVMKMRKKLPYQQILSSLFEELTLQFKPKVLAIKKNIDVLIEKEYLERVNGEENCFQYLA